MTFVEAESWAYLGLGYGDMQQKISQIQSVQYIGRRWEKISSPG